ncbi:MAG: hypothetical protein NTV88_04135, partial [Candidatus Micrarchaeota archaeon]|nr:hypothetical protein [Candidatus Micrarchaeota archaeon]
QMPESELIRGECLVRDLQFNEDVKLTRKGLVRWVALSLGLISPHETRAGLLEVLEALLYFHFRRREEKSDPDIHQILAKIKEIKKSEPNPKAVRYHLLQLKKLGLIETKKRKYRFVLAPLQENDDLAAGLAYVYRQRVDSTFEKMKKALSLLEKTL